MDHLKRQVRAHEARHGRSLVHRRAFNRILRGGACDGTLKQLQEELNRACAFAEENKHLQTANEHLQAENKHLQEANKNLQQELYRWADESDESESKTDASDPDPGKRKQIGGSRFFVEDDDDDTDLE